MSWQTYVDDHLMCEIEGNHLSVTAIISHDGSVWAQSATFPQGVHFLNEEDTGKRERFNARQIGSRPPECRRQGGGCGHCVGVQVPVAP